MSSRSAASYTVMDLSGGRAEAAALVKLLHAAAAGTEHCSEAWVANHYRWIVWKLVCYNRRLLQQLAGRMLTVPVVLDQLKYWYHIYVVKALPNKYKREYRKGQHLVLKKVLEQDKRASRAINLCIAEVLRPSATQQGLLDATTQQSRAGPLLIRATAFLSVLRQGLFVPHITQAALELS